MVVLNRARYWLGGIPNLATKSRRIVSALPKPASRAVSVTPCPASSIDWA